MRVKCQPRSACVVVAVTPASHQSPSQTTAPLASDITATSALQPCLHHLLLLAQWGHAGP